MKDVIPAIEKWLEAGEQIALATVVATWGSSPRQAGAKMALTASGQIAGSVSGGCVEGAVIEAGQEVLATGIPQLLHFGVADETAWDVGLACGGQIDVFVQDLNTAVYPSRRNLIQQNQSGASITIISGPNMGQTLVVESGEPLAGELPHGISTAAVSLAQSARHSQRVQLSDEITVFLEVMNPAPTLLMVGGVQIAQALATMAHTLGFRTIVVDPRRAFGSAERFSHVDQLIQAWPDKALADVELTPETAVTLLTHDPKIDDPALKIVLNSPVFYIGALGSRNTHAKRRERLQKMGFDETAMDRIHGPIGLDIGARSPEEIALSIMAEIVRDHHAG
ncbi:MAG: XdhC family protein [Ardenticatenaceae bacterium]|nr:XdhC family protein [Ardenticatenaceae bacterium]MCB9443827.1 XdhC family protein [Ardenticatenaceae bacterium]